MCCRGHTLRRDVIVKFFFFGKRQTILTIHCHFCSKKILLINCVTISLMVWHIKYLLGNINGQQGLGCCNSWGCKESDMTERLNWTDTTILYSLRAKSLQSCPTLCDPMEWRLPGFSLHGILQAWILEWVAMPFSSLYLPPFFNSCFKDESLMLHKVPLCVRAELCHASHSRSV